MNLPTRQLEQLGMAAGYDAVWYLPATGEVFVDFHYRTPMKVIKSCLIVDKCGKPKFGVMARRRRNAKQLIRISCPVHSMKPDTGKPRPVRPSSKSRKLSKTK